MKDSRTFTIESESQWHTVFKKAVKPYLEAKKVLTITVEPFRKKRSVDQNRRYFALLNQIASQMPPLLDGQWYSPDAYHEYCKRRFLGVVPGPFGEPIPRSTRNLSVVEFMGYVDEIEAHFIDQGVIFDTEAAA